MQFLLANMQTLLYGLTYATASAGIAGCTESWHPPLLSVSHSSFINTIDDSVGLCGTENAHKANK